MVNIKSTITLIPLFLRSSREHQHLLLILSSFIVTKPTLFPMNEMIQKYTNSSYSEIL
jgi:hypothetical protein